MSVEFWAQLVDTGLTALKGEDLPQFLFPTSLMGFVGCATALNWLPNDPTLFEAMVGCCGVAFGSGARLWKIRQLRSRLITRAVFDAEYFWGRNEDIRNIIGSTPNNLRSSQKWTMSRW